MSRRRTFSIVAALVAIAALVLAGPRPHAAIADSGQLFIYRVGASSDAAAQRLFDRGFDVLENRAGSDLFVLGNAATADKLRAAGFQPAIAEKVDTGGWQAPSTRLVPDAAGPAVAQIHAREIVTGDLAWRFIDHLVANAGGSTAALLASTEIWVVPIVNPDGVDLVQQGGNRPYLQRKNLDASGSTSCPRPPTGSGQV